MAPAPHFTEDLMDNDAMTLINYSKELARLMAFKLTVKEAMRMAEHNPHEALDMIDKALKDEHPYASTD